MLEAIEYVERYASQGKEAFERNELMQNWIVRHLQILGEAARARPQEIRQRAPTIPWSPMIGMRRTLVHDYFRIDTVIVWDVVARHLPGLNQALLGLLNDLEARE